MYFYYQKEGGTEEWKIVPAEEVSKLAPHMFRTILALDTPPTESSTPDVIAGIRYSGPLYFDLDDGEAPESTAKHLLALIEKLNRYDVQTSCMKIYASGGKGFHLLVDQGIFIEKIAKQGYSSLPTIYKEIAYELAVPSMDFRVYTARQGRMFRVANVQRENRKFKVQITFDELTAVAEAEDGREAYNQMCANPRPEFDVSTEPRAFGLQALFDTCRKRVDSALKRRAKAEKVTLPEELPSFEALLRGEGVRPGIGFQTLALQIAIVAHTTSMEVDELISAAEGLLTNHVSDGNRYNSRSKREYELRRMFDYIAENPCYPYSAGAIRSLLTHQAPDLAGIKTTDEEVKQAIINSDNGDTSGYDHAGVILTHSGVAVPVDGGARSVLAMQFNDLTEMVSADTGTATSLQALVAVPGASGNSRELGRRVFNPADFNSASALNKAVMPYGQAFMGNDQHARGVYLRLIEKARAGGRRVYTLSREGVDVVSMPFHENVKVREGAVVFADQKDVLVPRDMSDQADFNLQFVGYPNPLGIFQSDLSMAPRMAELKPHEVEEMRETILNLVTCQSPDVLSKLIGWMVAANYRMLFHKAFNQFPLLHVAGVAGSGKTAMVKLVANLHYYRQEVQDLSPTSTDYAIREAAASSSSIPLIIDEYKPHEMANGRPERFRLMFRDAYNCKRISRGGGTAESSDVRTIQTMQISAPIVFIAEAAETEPAVMERVILLTMSKPPGERSAVYFSKFQKVLDSRLCLGTLGAYIVKQLVNSYTVERLKSEFSGVHDQVRREIMLQPGEELTLTAEERAKKLGAKDRTAYNYAVLKFGLLKFQALARTLIERDTNEERKDAIAKACTDMLEAALSNIEELQAQTMPEWLKVFNSLSDMAGASDTDRYRLFPNRDYLLGEVDGQAVLELNVRSCYMKYRMYCSAVATKPLFPSEAAFIHAVNHIPYKVGHGHQLVCPGGSRIFNLDDIRACGFIDMPDAR